MDSPPGPSSRAAPLRGYLFGFIVFLILFSATFHSVLHRLSSHGGDFHQFLEDGQLALSDRQLGAALPLEYPPTARPLFMLLAVLPIKLSLTLWWLLNAWMYWQAAWWLATPAPGDRGGSANAVVWLLIGLSAIGIWSDLSVGQLTGLTLFCVVACQYLERRNRCVAGGCLLAIPLLIKPLPIILLLYYATRRRWKLLIATGVSYLLLGPCLIAGLFGWPEEIDGWRWFFNSTARERSPLHVFTSFAAAPGLPHTYLESGLSSSLVRLLLPTPYDSAGHAVQIATWPPAFILLLWIALVAAPVGVGCLLAARQLRLTDNDHVFGAFAGVMMLLNPKFISYWLAFGLAISAPLAGCALDRRVGRGRRALAIFALAASFAGSATVAWPAARAAGSFVAVILILTWTNLALAATEPDADTGTTSESAPKVAATC